jgi:parvulin-like peptidyl-prolyl isomerase
MISITEVRRTGPVPTRRPTRPTVEQEETGALKSKLSCIVAVLVLASLGRAAEDPPSWPPPSDLPDGVLATVEGDEIPLEGFYARLAREQGPGPAGIEALEQLVETRLVELAMERRSITVDEAEVDAKYDELARRIEESTGGKATLAGELERGGISPERFRSQLRFLVGLEKLARADFEIPDSEPVPDSKASLWLTQLTENADVRTEGLPDGIAARTKDFEVTMADLGRALARVTPTVDLVRLARTMVSEHLIDRAAAKYDLRVDRPELVREMEHRRRAFEESERYPGVPFDQFVQATQGASPESLLDSESFRHQVLLKKLVAKIHSVEERRAYYEEHRGRYGPLRKIQHLLVSTENRDPDEARELAERLRGEVESGADFESLVRGHSDGPNRMAGGNLGYLPPEGELPAVLLEAAFRLESGKMSEPIRTEQGYHLIRVTGVRPVPSFEEAEELVLRDLARDWLREAQRTSAVRPGWIYPKRDDDVGGAEAAESSDD